MQGNTLAPTYDRASSELGVILLGVEAEILLEESGILGHHPPGFVLLFLGDLQDQDAAVHVDADLSLRHRLQVRKSSTQFYFQSL